MSTGNIVKFRTAIENQPEWLERVQAITGTREECVKQLVAFSEEIGFPVTAEEFHSEASSDSGELSGEELSGVAGGGRGNPPEWYAHDRVTGGRKRRIHETE